MQIGQEILVEDLVRVVLEKHSAGRPAVVSKEKFAAELALRAHCKTCAECRGPDDVCEVGAELEHACFALGFDPYAGPRGAF